ncbi:opioid-binding protein/cell adhesion molecule homolog isoform X2 [Drosophila tropicalis]|uniref:opioid-binding protein/cell adhesion molecule homolog isoform X2 n=1 Tax=Drosophila tropicalis TaxID=46794 RepID=UPI0035ABD7F5
MTVTVNHKMIGELNIAVNGNQLISKKLNSLSNQTDCPMVSNRHQRYISPKLARLEITNGNRRLLRAGTTTLAKEGRRGGGARVATASGSAYCWQLILLMLFSSCIVGAFEPDFVIPLENVTVAQGRDATFTCVVNNLGGHRVSGDGASAPAKVAWIKADAKAILAIHEHVITNNDRLSVTHNDYNTWTLNIRSVKMEDAGKYMCQVNTDPMKMQTATLEVVIPPDIINEETSGDMMVPEGGSAKLICRARGHPKPKITWRREDGREIIARNGVHQKTKAQAVEGEMLTLSKVTRSEMGAYMCIASNGVPPTVSKRMKLQVHFHPLVQVPNQLVGAPVLTDVTLICNVEASPKAINYWQRENGEMIIAGDRYALTEKENNMYAIEMILHIKRLQSSDFGGYKCISKNSIGDTEGTIRLYEMERPGKKNLRDDDLNEVTKNEVVLKENRHEDGSRNQNGRLYKDRNQDADTGSGADPVAAKTTIARTMQLIKTFLLALLVLMATTLRTRRSITTRATTTKAMYCYGRQRPPTATRTKLNENSMRSRTTIKPDATVEPHEHEREHEHGYELVAIGRSSNNKRRLLL